MISEERAEKAVEFIRDHADQLGQLIGRAKALEQQRKVVHGQQYLEAEGSVAERNAKAESSKAFQVLVNDIQNAWAEKTTIEVKIKAAELTIEVWRSQFSKYGKGHV